MSHVTFDGANKLIIVDFGVDEIEAFEIYSEWKEWATTSDNAKYLIAMRTVGGDPTTGIKSVAPYFFLSNGWKIRPYEGDHYLNINGNIFVDEPETYGYQVFVHTLGDHMVTVAVNLTSDAVGIATGGSTAPSAADVATAVWNKILSAGVAGTVLSTIFDDVAYIRLNGTGGEGGMPADVIDKIRRLKRVLLTP
jgi:hypothetical protein